MRRRPFLAAALALALIFFVALLVAWQIRFRVATMIVDRRLAAAGAAASYRITRIGPFLERMEEVRIGSPAAPDIVARRIDVTIGYGLTGPSVRAISVDGVRLRGTLGPNGLSFGSLDRLLPKAAGGAAKLPDLDLTLRDSALALTTPNGIIHLAAEGAGNPAHRFNGAARIASPTFSFGKCAVKGVTAELRIATRAGQPQGSGPARAGTLVCPGMALGAGTAQLALSANRTFEQLTLRAGLAGFGGEAGSIRFARLTGSAEAAGTFGNLDAGAKLRLLSLSAPQAATAIARSGAMLAGTPLAPTVARATAAIARLLEQADAQAEVVAAFRGREAEVHVKRLQLAGRDGARLRAVERGGLSWSPAGWRADADIATNGGALPTTLIKLRQAAPRAPLAGVAQLRPYRVGEAQLAATPIQFRWDGRAADLATVAMIDGPLAGGFVRGLTVPVQARATTAGAILAGPGCETITFRELRLTSFTFGAARIPVCGRPIVMRAAGGTLRIDAATGPIRLAGHTTNGASVALATARLRLTQAGFMAQDLTTSLGGSAQPTHIAIGVLDGTFRRGQLRGRFDSAAGGIGNVPLVIADAGGSWALEGSALRLAGKFGVSDAAAAARFYPLATEDAVLTLRNSAIAATATLRAPASRIEVAKVTLAHDLAAGSGHALLNVPGIAFTPKGLQPEKLTPLTLGVIANVAGTVSGNGRIDWGPAGVTSRGTFGTERIDLAAAFGPVTGVKGQLHFTDLLGLVSAPHQEATIAEINPGVSVTNGVVHYQLTGRDRVHVEDAHWPFAGGDLRLDPTTLDFGAEVERHLTFRIAGLDAAAFVQQLDFPNISATGTFDGVLPMIFDHSGGRIEGGTIIARKSGGSLAYVGELSNADIGAMGKLAFDALKAIRYSALDISLDGRLDGEMVSRVRFTGVREATPEQSLVTRLIRNLPFRFNIQIRAPFRGLVGSARAYIDPRLLLTQIPPKPAPSPIQPSDSGPVR